MRDEKEIEEEKKRRGRGRIYQKMSIYRETTPKQQMEVKYLYKESKYLY